MLCNAASVLMSVFVTRCFQSSSLSSSNEEKEEQYIGLSLPVHSLSTTSTFCGTIVVTGWILGIIRTQAEVRGQNYMGGGCTGFDEH